MSLRRNVGPNKNIDDKFIIETTEEIELTEEETTTLRYNLWEKRSKFK